MPLKSKIYQVSDDEFRIIVKNSCSFSDCLRAVGLGTNGGSSSDILKRRIRELNCSIEHFSRGTDRGVHQTYSLSEILIKNSSYTNISSLKRRLLYEKLLDYQCDECGLKEWRGAPISLHLDHINGQNTDHRLENLRLLCPNCHSQTDTYAGKNKYNVGE